MNKNAKFKRITFFALVAICFSAIIVYSVNYINLPELNRYDRVLDVRNIGGNITADYIFGKQNWSHIDYPAACPANYAVTEIGDATVCTSGLVTSNNVNISLTYEGETLVARG